jgi:hypothetical protein
VGTRSERTGIRWKERREGAECATRREKRWNGCREMRERIKKERGGG